MLGMVSEADKASLLHSVDVYVAPNTGGESFGIILLEALAAGAPIVASDLPAFRRVLDPAEWQLPEEDGHRAEPRTGYRRVRAGLLFRNRDAAALAQALERALSDAALRRELAEAGAEVVRPYDWRLVAAQILRVYEIACAATVRS